MRRESAAPDVGQGIETQPDRVAIPEWAEEEVAAADVGAYDDRANAEPMPPLGVASEEPGGRGPPLPPPPFGSTDPHQRAKRLARALVSDIVVYHPDRRDRGLREGRLRQEFREEIRKSWDEYAAQVGDPLARETSYFRDALNEILAKGTQLF